VKLAAFDPPGNLTDFSTAQRTGWSQFMSDTIDASIAGTPQSFTHDSPRAQFYNPLTTDTADDAQTKDITWTAFPNLVKRNSVSDQQRWQRADASRDVQDEYCEWSVTRNDAGKITRVTFTCEGPEYWAFLARSNPSQVLALYQQFVNQDIKQSDLLDTQGQYNPRNAFNDSTAYGAMHLIQANNTLGAEIDIAADATIVRVINGQTLTGEQELIACGQYGQPDRNSDPHIGGEVNALARLKADITLANPVGLYFAGFAPVGWTTPDGTDSQAFWTVVRGDANHAVRAVYEVPAAKGYVVGDIKVQGQPLSFGAQIADAVTMKLTGLACRVGQSTVAPQTACKEQVSSIAGSLSVADAISAAFHPRTFR